MPASEPVTASAPMAQTLARALWGQSWCSAAQPGALPEQRPVITLAPDQRWTLHLPPAPDTPGRPGALAVASHAAAHARFGGEPQERRGLKPVQQALFGVLEDARVEWLALQELPGLRAVWWPWHAGPAAGYGASFEDLLARLSASLLDPSHHDPHPWLARVHQLFFENDGHTLALKTTADVRRAASVLGHDIGQMRLPFNARSYRVAAGYRDDNSHLWLQDDSLPPSETTLASGVSEAPGASGAPALSASSAQGPSADGAADTGPPDEPPDALHPEWDHRIGRYRPRWCRVYDASLGPLSGAGPERTGQPGRVNRLAQRLARLGGRYQAGAGRSAVGDELHIDALVEGRLDLRAGRTPDARAYRRPWRQPHPLAVLLLVDASASTAGALLNDIRQAATTASLALRHLGHRTGVWAFSSHGRHRIHMPCLQPWGQGALIAAAPRLAAEGSTRLGAALRHALHLTAQDARRHPGWRRVVVVVTDGELHDVDVHDPAYLPADAQRAAREAEAQGVAVRCLVFPPGEAGTLAQAIGRDHCRTVPTAAHLPLALVQLLSGLDRSR